MSSYAGPAKLLKSIFSIRNIDGMNLAAIDLNLLVAFEALYDTRNVTLAGQRIHRAQFREQRAGAAAAAVPDELFLRTAEGMQPTPKADALMPAVSAALDQIRQALAQGAPFDPGSAQGRRFTIAASDYADVVIVPHIVAALRRDAPGRTCAWRGWTAPSSMNNWTMAAWTWPSAAIWRRPSACCPNACTTRASFASPTSAIRRCAPQAGPGTLSGPAPRPVHAQRRRLGARRGRRRPSAPGPQAARGLHLRAHRGAAAVRGTDLIATLARRAARRRRLTLRPLPAEVDPGPFSIDMVCSRRAPATPRWLAATAGPRRRAALAGLAPATHSPP